MSRDFPIDPGWFDAFAWPVTEAPDTDHLLDAVERIKSHGPAPAAQLKSIVRMLWFELPDTAPRGVRNRPGRTTVEVGKQLGLTPQQVVRREGWALAQLREILQEEV